MKRFGGILLLVIVVAIVAGWQLFKGSQTKRLQQYPPATLVGKAGSEKADFLQNPKIKVLLQNKYNLAVDFKKAGSVEMVSEPIDGLDVLWPASTMNVEYYRERNRPLTRSEDIFSSPLVFYSWDIVTDCLMANGIVEKTNACYYLVNFSKLLNLIEKKTKWAEIGLSHFPASMLVQSTDPARSNSGNLWAALLLNMFNGGEVPNAAQFEQLAPRVQLFFERVGFMESSSGTLFEKYLLHGAGAYPLVVGYENQLLEFTLQHPELIGPVKSRLRILYPKPTVWSSHPLIALNEKGNRLVEALRDPEVQKIAWANHGFRSGRLGMVNDVSVMPLPGVPPTIDAVLPTPNAAVMMRMTELLTTRR